MVLFVTEGEFAVTPRSSRCRVKCEWRSTREREREREMDNGRNDCMGFVRARENQWGFHSLFEGDDVGNVGSMI